jgi:hypothetical protein
MKRDEIVDKVKRVMFNHQDLDWTCAVQCVAMEIGYNEFDLMDDLREEFVKAIKESK